MNPDFPSSIVLIRDAHEGKWLPRVLAGIPLVRQGRCLKDARFLRVDREDLLDLLMQRPGLQRQLSR